MKNKDIKTFDDKLQAVSDYLYTFDWMSNDDVHSLVAKFMLNNQSSVQDSRVTAQFDSLYADYIKDRGAS